MAVNAALCGLIAVLMASAIFRLFPAWFRWPALVVLALLFSLPFSWENTLAGFQSQFYFLLLFSLLSIWGLGIHTWSSRAWLVGACALPLACLSMASGFFAALSILGIHALRLLKERKWPVASDWFTCLFCIIFIVAGWMSRTVVPGHEYLKAESLSGWIRALARCLAWPWYDWRPVALVMQLPVTLLLIVYLVGSGKRWEEKSRARFELLLGLAFWFFSQAVAVAYARGAQTQPLSPRYMDILALGAAVNFIAALLLAGEASKSGAKKLPALMATGWAMVFLS